jgi:hypothetical protein
MLSNLTVENSTFSGNRANFWGGGIGNYYNLFPVAITTSTFSGNDVQYYASGGGAGVYNRDGTIDITHTTFVGNTDAVSNYDSYNDDRDSTITLRNTILTNSTMANCTGPITDGGHNLQFPGQSGCDNHGFLTADPLLGPLQDNGGPTFTHALLPGSPAIDAVPLADCAGVATDQRGVERPQGPACDIGAYEFGSPKKSIEGLIKQVLQLTETGTLNGGQGNSLIAKLEAAIGQLDRGNDRVAVNQLRSFTNEVEAKLSSGLLSAEEGQPLIDAANEIIALLSS